MAAERALRRGNPFVEPDRESARDRTNQGHSVLESEQESCFTLKR